MDSSLQSLEHELRVITTIAKSPILSNPFLSILQFCYPISYLRCTNRQSLYHLKNSFVTICLNKWHFSVLPIMRRREGRYMLSTLT